VPIGNHRTHWVLEAVELETHLQAVRGAAAEKSLSVGRVRGCAFRMWMLYNHIKRLDIV
jgi:hypothetical protein